MRDTSNWKTKQKECENCKKFFKAFAFRKQRFCSMSCARYKTVWNKGNEDKLVKSICKVCPNTIEYYKSNSHEFCSRVCMGKFNSKEKHYLWVKDRTHLKDDSKDRGGQLHREWSKNVKNRDKWSCRIADINCEGRLEAHHILGWKLHPELRYQINNGITLCHAHHPRKREDESKLSPYFKQLVAEMK